MEQKSIFENSFVSGVIVNDANYVPVNEEVFTDPEEIDQNIEKGYECQESSFSCADKTEDVCLNPCEEFKNFTVHNVHLHCEGRILRVKVELRDVCKGRKLRLAVLLFEKDCRETELKGLRTCEITVPGFTPGFINELTVGDFCFIIPEDHNCMNYKEVKIEVIAHYSSFPQ